MAASPIWKTTLSEAILLAAEAVGSDGNGLDGVRGYLQVCASRYPKQYMNLIKALIPLQVVSQTSDDLVMKTAQEVRQSLLDRGLPVPKYLFEQEWKPPEQKQVIQRMN